VSIFPALALRYLGGSGQGDKLTKFLPITGTENHFDQASSVISYLPGDSSNARKDPCIGRCLTDRPFELSDIDALLEAEDRREDLSQELTLT